MALSLERAEARTQDGQARNAITNLQNGLFFIKITLIVRFKNMVIKYQIRKQQSSRRVSSFSRNNNLISTIIFFVACFKFKNAKANKKIKLEMLSIFRALNALLEVHG